MDIESEAAVRRKGWGVKPRSPAAILVAQNLSAGRRRPRSLQPQPSTRRAKPCVAFLWDAYALFVAAYRAAAEKLRAGIRDVAFPIGSFPPALPFMGG